MSEDAFRKMQRNACKQRALIIEVDPNADPRMLARMARQFILFAFIKCTICDEFGHNAGYCPYNGMMYAVNRYNTDRSLFECWRVWKSGIGSKRKLDDKRKAEDLKIASDYRHKLAFANVPRDESSANASAELGAISREQLVQLQQDNAAIRQQSEQ